MEKTSTLDLRRFYKLIRLYWRMLGLWMVGLGVIAWALAAFVLPPQYTATTQLLVNQRSEKDTNGQAYNNQQADIQLITTYKDIITNQVILKAASHQLANPKGNNRGYSYSPDQLKKSLNVKTQQNSQVFALNAKASTPEAAEAIANTVAGVFRTKVKKIMNVNNVTVVAAATSPQKPSFPNPKLFALGGAVLGLVLALAGIVLRDMLDTTVQDTEFMDEDLGVTNLGLVNHIQMPRNFNVGDPTGERHRRRV